MLDSLQGRVPDATLHRFAVACAWWAESLCPSQQNTKIMQGAERCLEDRQGFDPETIEALEEAQHTFIEQIYQCLLSFNQQQSDFRGLEFEEFASELIRSLQGQIFFEDHQPRHEFQPDFLSMILWSTSAVRTAAMLVELRSDQWEDDSARSRLSVANQPAALGRSQDQVSAAVDSCRGIVSWVGDAYENLARLRRESGADLSHPALSRFIRAGEPEPTLNEIGSRVQRAQADLLREVLGNPFEVPIVLDRSWILWNDQTVAHMAHAIDESQDFLALPILADALEEAGCDQARLLDHFRSRVRHDRQCWALRLIKDAMPIDRMGSVGS